MRPADALARYLWEEGEGLDIYTDPDLPPGHLVVKDGSYTRVFLPHEVGALAQALLGLGCMDEKGRPLSREVFGRGARRCEEVSA